MSYGEPDYHVHVEERWEYHTLDLYFSRVLHDGTVVQAFPWDPGAPRAQPPDGLGPSTLIDGTFEYFEVPERRVARQSPPTLRIPQMFTVPLLRALSGKGETASATVMSVLAREQGRVDRLLDAVLAGRR